MPPVIPQTPPNYDSTRILERPDGFYWQDKASGEEFGPFATLLDAVADMEATDREEDLEVGESLEEAEDEVGIADWIDPETGLPAEGPGPRTDDR